MKSFLSGIILSAASFAALAQSGATSPTRANTGDAFVKQDINERTPTSTASSVTVSPAKANLTRALMLYGDLTKRTALLHPATRQMTLNLKTSSTNRADTARLIETLLVEQNFIMIPDGEKFVLVAHKDQASSLNPKSSAIPQLGTNVSRTDILPKGAIHFESASVDQVLPIYAEISGKKLDRSAALPRGTPDYIYLITQTELTKGEVLYAMDTLLGWHGIKVMPLGDGLLKAVAATEQQPLPQTK